MENDMLMLNRYGFFDSPYELSSKGYTGSDRMSVQQLVFMSAVFAAIIIASVLLRNRKKILFVIYRVMAILMPVLEIIKIVFSSYHDIKNGQPFNWGGILPFYTCSMLLYFLPVLAWGKGKWKEYSAAFFTTVGLVAGLTNFVYLSAAGWYPLFTYGCLHSVLFHAALVFVGLSLMISGEYIPQIKTFYKGMYPVLLFSAFVIPINFIVKHTTQDTWVDYMLLMNCNGLPVIGDFAGLLSSKGLTIVFTLIMLFVAYPLATFLITLIDSGFVSLVGFFSDFGSRKQD